MTADLIVQKAIRDRLIGTSSVTDLVPATAILDRNARPNPDPSIILGEGETYPGDDVGRHVLRIVSTMHVWKKEPSLAGVKAIAGAIRTAIHSQRLALETGFHCGDCRVSASRYVRDPDGETSHAVVTVETLVREA